MGLILCSIFFLLMNKSMLLSKLASFNLVILVKVKPFLCFRDFLKGYSCLHFISA